MNYNIIGIEGIPVTCTAPIDARLINIQPIKLKIKYLNNDTR